jgi:hypothetical protein
MAGTSPAMTDWDRARAKLRHELTAAVKLARLLPIDESGKRVSMDVKVRKIEVDVETADLLEARAAALGMSVSTLLAELAGNESILPPDLAEMRAKGEGPWSPEALEDDARRLAEFERTRMAVPWDEVRAWMQSWGKPNELPRPEPRKL